MVQYVHTPWRDRAELLKVRRQFYPDPPPAAEGSGPTALYRGAEAETPRDVSLLPKDVADDGASGRERRAEVEAEKQHAVARVAMWMQRGGCPHVVESTALLTAATLNDASDARDAGAQTGSSAYAIRAAYSAAFSRFVTGLLDGQQDKQRKMSMYSVAKTIALPATFVELRHQATHEQLPSLSKLRAAARAALAWMWDYYWKNLTDGSADGVPGQKTAPACRDLLLRCLEKEDEEAAGALRRQLGRWDESVVLQNLAEIADASEDPRIIARSLRLSRALLDEGFPSLLGTDVDAAERPAGPPNGRKDLDAVRAELETSSRELEEAAAAEVDSTAARAVEKKDAPPTPASQVRGWSKYEGTWKPKPIGVV
ncbi:Las1-domain-containing protein [Durotheca rogersii]|uniref:Las1-domain-containing protein n=1 Tax=Durotheca rogersii TaxID=419775 RepID=UPI00221ED06D|nr:Las1-domain-containing protein [Durotheca rogersii]KAI5862791.1 Las1-domain-containing protein [Durotheca rogersii]